MAFLRGALSAQFSSQNSAYRDRLSPFEQKIFDAFHLYQEAEPDHQVFAVFEETSGAHRFASFPCVAVVPKDERWGAKTIVALNLSDRFENQWSAESEGKITASNLKKDPVIRLPPLRAVPSKLCFTQ